MSRVPSAYVSIQYDDENQSSYEYIEVSWSRGGKIYKEKFSSGDPIKDWETMLKFANQPGKFSMTMFSSSVDHFLMDGDGFHLKMVDGLYRLKRGKAKFLKFKCPNCDGDSLTEVMVNVTQETRVTMIHDCAEDGMTFEYNDHKETFDGEVDHWSCSNCHTIFPTEEELRKHLIETK
jgi:hypothetical protein